MTTQNFDNYADPQMCRQCRRLCCQGHPGAWVDPEHFFKAFDLPKTSSPQTLHRLLPRELLLRNIDGVAIPAAQKRQSGWIFLKSDGCQLPVNRRPDQSLAQVLVFSLSNPKGYTDRLSLGLLTTFSLHDIRATDGLSVALTVFLKSKTGGSRPAGES